jgi:hypothetical protein
MGPRIGLDDIKKYLAPTRTRTATLSPSGRSLSLYRLSYRDYLFSAIYMKIVLMSNVAGLENRDYGLGIRHADHATPSIRKSWY